MGIEETGSGHKQTKSQKLPVGWAKTTLGDILSLEYGKSLIKGSRIEEGEYPVYGSSGVVGFHNKSLVSKPAIIVGRKGAAGAVHLCKNDSWPIDTTYFVKPSRSLSTDFIYHLLKFCRLHKYESSTAIPGLNRDHAYSEQISLPPLPEQKRIVDKIEDIFSELDKGVENLRAARQQLKVYRQALLKHAFAGKLTVDWRAQNPDKLESADALLASIQQEREARYQQQLQDWQTAQTAWESSDKTDRKPSKPKAPKDLLPLTSGELMDLPELPQGWAWTRLGNTNCDVSDGPFGSNLKGSDYVASGVRVIRLENIGELEFFEDKKSFISEEKYETISNHTVKYGDIIFSSFITENVRTTLLPKNIDRAVNKADCFCIRIYGETLSNKYTVMFLATRHVFKQLESLIHGVGRPRINTSQLKDVFIPTCSCEEQNMVISGVEAQLSEIDQLETTITHSLQQADALRQSILKKAFAGQLVPQHHVEEPASALLTRIQAERANHTKTTAKIAKTAKPRTRQAKAHLNQQDTSL